MAEFAKGIFLKEFTFKPLEGEEYSVIKMGIHRDDFNKNAHWNKNGWSNFEIRFAKDNHRPYAVIDVPTNTIKSTVDPKPSESADNEEIPF